MNSNAVFSDSKNISRAASLSELLAHWRVQENLLQGYRRLFLTVETILLSVAAVVVSSKFELLLSIIVIFALLLVGIVTAVFFLPIIKKRGEVVFFWQAKILKTERGEKVILPFAEMKDFQRNVDHEFRNDPDFQSLGGGKHMTRWKLNFWLPMVILLAWIGILIAFILRALPELA